ncbi:hypothetical protein L596_009366 [Steinernema carpocapsae]|uniref:Uncharacterized protein n=1 Tax=Steinernema carpocapsae TaxID=34508 RepID=A0A4U5PFN5_STECR|nr:hypothetical protein L596_009366 [Steinernema carpocapsae]
MLGKSDASEPIHIRAWIPPNDHTKMDQVPFTFVDSAAHLVSPDSATTFSRLEDPVWSCVGRTHCEKIVEYNFTISAPYDDGELTLESTDGPKSVEEVLKSDLRFTRIDQLTLFQRIERKFCF